MCYWGEACQTKMECPCSARRALSAPMGCCCVGGELWPMRRAGRGPTPPEHSPHTHTPLHPHSSSALVPPPLLTLDGAEVHACCTTPGCPASEGSVLQHWGKKQPQGCSGKLPKCLFGGPETPLFFCAFFWGEREEGEYLDIQLPHFEPLLQICRAGNIFLFPECLLPRLKLL